MALALALASLLAPQTLHAAQPKPYVKSISVSATHSCALLSNETIQCWGENEFGQLGNRTRDNSSVPVEVIDERHIIAVRAGDGFTCAVHSSLDDGRVDCWGLNNQGQLGRGGTSPFSIFPAPVAGLDSKTNLYGVDALMCSNGSCWGRFAYPIRRYTSFGGSYGWVPDLVSLFYSTYPYSFVGSATVFGAGHYCNLSGGRVYCYGDDRDGQRGNSAGGNVASGIASATVVAAGGRNTCALLKNTTVKCWGAEMRSTNLMYAVPSTVEGLTGVVAISMAGDTTTVKACGIVENGRVWCWGTSNGDIGPIASPLSGIDRVTQLQVGPYHSCAMREDRTIWCWGDGAYGRLGNGGEASSEVPVQVVMP